MSLSTAAVEDNGWSWRLSQSANLSAPALDTDPASADITWQPFTAGPRPAGHWHKRRRLRRFSSDEDETKEAISEGPDKSDHDAASQDEAVGEHDDILADSSSDSEQEEADGTVVPEVKETDEKSQTPQPLTMKETQRLISLIKIMFRFKIPSSRRRLEEAQALTPPHQDAQPDQAMGSSSKILDPAIQTGSAAIAPHPYLQDLKPKYSVGASSRSSSHVSRSGVARIHPRDAFSHSRAAKRLAALLPATFPERMETSPASVDWIVNLVLQATRDAHGNILLPDAAFASSTTHLGTVAGDTNSQSSEVTLSAADETITPSAEASAPARRNLTRSAYKQQGLQAPAIPLPAFWRHKDAQRASASPAPSSSAGVDSDASYQDVTAVPADESETTITVDSPLDSTIQAPASSITNFSAVLARKANAERQAQKLLLRTHKSLRKPAHSSS